MGEDRWPMMVLNYKCEGGRVRQKRKAGKRISWYTACNLNTPRVNIGVVYVGQFYDLETSVGSSYVVRNCRALSETKFSRRWNL
jgi:hypothetical protein